MALFFTYVLPLLLPTAIYMLWRLITAQRRAGVASNTTHDSGSAAAIAPSDDPWRDAPWLWLAIAGAVLLAIVLSVGVFFHGTPGQGHYVPPRMEDGHIVPGQLQPGESVESPGGSPSGAR